MRSGQRIGEVVERFSPVRDQYGHFFATWGIAKNNNFQCRFLIGECAPGFDDLAQGLVWRFHTVGRVNCPSDFWDSIENSRDALPVPPQIWPTKRDESWFELAVVSSRQDGIFTDQIIPKHSLYQEIK